MSAGPAFLGRSFYATLNRRVPFGGNPPLVLTRPNNVVAYTAGQVYGPAGDARLTFTSPALPADARDANFDLLAFTLIQGVGPATPSVTFNLVVARAPFTSVAGDQTVLSLNDADIANLILPNAGSSPGILVAGAFTTGFGNFVVNASAGLAGRRMYSTSASVPNLLPPLTTYGLYVWVNAAYVPLALETLTIIPYFTYSQKLTTY